MPSCFQLHKHFLKRRQGGSGGAAKWRSNLIATPGNCDFVRVNSILAPNHSPALTAYGPKRRRAPSSGIAALVLLHSFGWHSEFSSPIPQRASFSALDKRRTFLENVPNSNI